MQGLGLRPERADARAGAAHAAHKRAEARDYHGIDGKHDVDRSDLHGDGRDGRDVLARLDFLHDHYGHRDDLCPAHGRWRDAVLYGGPWRIFSRCDELIGAAMMGVPQAGDSLDALANLATALTDPATLKKNIAALKQAQADANKAQADAQATIDAAAAAQKALDARKAEMEARDAKLTEDVKNAAARTAHLENYAAELAQREKALRDDVAALDTARKAWAADKATAERDAATQAANAAAALDKRAKDLQAREAAVTAAERASAEQKASLDAWSAQMAAAAARR